jgi:hypothetical protein
METSSGIMAGFAPEKEVALELGVTTRTLARWRKMQIGPPYVRTGRDVIYNIERAKHWLAAGGTATAVASPRRRRSG